MYNDNGYNNLPSFVPGRLSEFLYKVKTKAYCIKKLKTQEFITST